MDYSQQIEALRLDAPEQLGRERVFRVATAVENVLKATAGLDVNRNAAAAVIAEAERIINDEAVLAEADAVVAAEARRMASIEAQRGTNPSEEQYLMGKEALDAANQMAKPASAYDGNPFYN